MTATRPENTRTAPRPDSDRADSHGFHLTIDLEEGLRQTVEFETGWPSQMMIDEPPPLGSGYGPSPAKVLGAAVGSCLAASLAFCLRKSRIEVQGVRTSVSGTIARNERGRLRVSRIAVLLEPVIPTEDHERAGRCISMFEDFCTVTASIRPAIQVDVEVRL